MADATDLKFVPNGCGFDSRPEHKIFIFLVFPSKLSKNV